MFIEQFRLEQNPFGSGRARPVFGSHSFQNSASKVALLLRGHLQCLFLTGAAGAGKTTVIESELAKSSDTAIGRVATRATDPVRVLRKLVKELGLGDVDGNASELRRILEVFLLHQSAQGRKSLIFADGVENDSPDVLREIEALVNLRSRGRPIVLVAMTTRNEELVGSLMSRHDGSVLAPALHQRLLGFTSEETAAYIRGSVEGAGCSWFSELFSEDLLVDIQSFTQGVVGDIDALCHSSLELLALRSKESNNQPRLTMSIVKAAAATLHLKYDAGAWKAQHEEVLDPGAIRESLHDQLRIEAAQLIVTSGGRRIAEITLNRPRMVLGRDSSCDISLDSSYVSRYQNLFMETGDGWMLIDLNSTNGCFVNGRRVHEHYLRDGDLISLGQHQLRFAGHEASEAELTATATASSETMQTKQISQ